MVNTEITIYYKGNIVNGEECFRDVMDAFPYDQLWELLNNPREIDITRFNYVINWCRPRVVKGETFVDTVVDSKLLQSRGEVYRKVKEGAMKWNGQRVTDANMPIDFLAPGWAVIQLGKKTHRVLLDKGWRYAGPDHPYNKESQ